MTDVPAALKPTKPAGPFSAWEFELALRYLNHTTIKIEELIGSGRNQKRMDEVPLAAITPYAAEDADVADAREALELLDDGRRGVVAEEDGIARGVGRDDRDRHEDVIRTLLGDDAETTHLLREAGLGQLDAVGHEDRRHVRVDAVLEGDGDAQRAARRGVGRIIKQAFDAVDLLLEGRGDVGGFGGPGRARLPVAAGSGRGDGRGDGHRRCGGGGGGHGHRRGGHRRGHGGRGVARSGQQGLDRLRAELGAARAYVYEALDRWLYRLPGGLVISNLGACAIFAALTGAGDPSRRLLIGAAAVVPGVLIIVQLVWSDRKARKKAAGTSLELKISPSMSTPDSSAAH